MTTKVASNEVQIRRLVNNWAKGVRERDMDSALAHHAKDMVMFDVPLPLHAKGMTWELFFGNVAGGNGGIGFEICAQLAERGAQVVLTARKREAGEGALSKLASSRRAGLSAQMQSPCDGL